MFQVLQVQEQIVEEAEIISQGPVERIGEGERRTRLHVS